MKREFLTVSNLLSIFRALLSIPFALVMLLPDPPLRFWALGILTAGMATDKLDGDLAGSRGEEQNGANTRPARRQDMRGGDGSCLLKLGDFPLWFVLALVIRDLVDPGRRALPEILAGRGPPSNAAGKMGRHPHRVHHSHDPVETCFRELQWILLAACAADFSSRLFSVYRAS